MTLRSSRTWLIRIMAGVAIVFGILTILSGGQVLFWGGAREAAGNVVPFVLWFNFLSGFIYVLAGLGMATNQGWAAKLTVALTGAIAVVFALFGLHILQGGAFEIRTVGAMTLRFAVWAAITACVVQISCTKRTLSD